MLLNEAGERFVSRYEPAGDLASRDLVARAIVREMERTARPCLPDAWPISMRAYIANGFPTITEACAHAGLDLAATAFR